MATGYRWVRLDLDYFRNPKARAAGLHGRALHLASICWSAGQLTDGQIATSALPTVLLDAGTSSRSIDLVVSAGLWVPDGDGYAIKDYSELNPTRASVEAERAQWRERQRRRRRDPDSGKYEK